MSVLSRFPTGLNPVWMLDCSGFWSLHRVMLSAGGDGSGLLYQRAHPHPVSPLFCFLLVKDVHSEVCSSCLVL